MTKNSDFKKLVRERMAKTGESYTTAKRNLEADREPTKPTLEGWVITGPGDNDPDFEVTDYEAGLEPGMRHKGKACAYIRSVVDEPRLHAVIMQSVNATKFHNERIRFSAEIRVEEEGSDGSLWLRVVPIKRDSSYAWGYAQATTEWHRGEIVVDVDPRATSIMLGVSLEGVGKVWMSDAQFEVVDQSVPLTGGKFGEWEPEAPVNLSFEGVDSVGPAGEGRG